MRHLNPKTPTDRQIISLLVLAFIFWAAVFAFKLVNFWLGLPFAAAFLAGLSIYFAGLPFSISEITLRNSALAVLSAILLYAVFAFGRILSMHLLHFAAGQIGDIYGIRHEAHGGAIALILFFLTSPCEELFWRGFTQRWSMERFGRTRGWILASFFYAAVHISSGNFMLTGAALTAGLFWGYLYMRTRSLYVCILSHSLWTVGIFLIWPLG